MTTSTRFERAITKLYSAFHNKTLNPDDCKECAVGNILDNKDHWQHLTDKHGSITLNYVGKVHQNLGRKLNGYTPIELLQIESAFLKGCGYHMTTDNRLHKPKTINNSVLFDGLCKVVETLCILDNINNIMDCSLLFNFKPQQLQLQDS
ncbi:Na(+)-translocating NADH-quinone reductase subunit F [uncultured Winogradskyella sp.]|uniref:Na(+)-translocating NADH-quinone reductase subunit F n=1 Tax=uncultured Winogradskyella sp. TaxID=395353 RepID=UPI002606E38E|nr:Na(+)-translocating NADH-quinone reductase subunit F [uncultured Winogradskyella sp.]